MSAMVEPPSPRVAEFYFEGEPHLRPERMVADRCEREGMTRDEIGVKQVAVATFFPQLTSFLAEREAARQVDFWGVGGRGRELFVVNDEVCIATLPVGAPAAAMLFEELVACGARTVLVAGAAGSLQRDLPIGSIVLPSATVREEGTSHHYLPPEAPVQADRELVQGLRSAWRHAGEPREGLHWTTDAPYREHKEKIDAYRDAGVLSVDMEVSALYAVAQHRGVACSAILAISDELYEPWRMGFAMPDFHKAMAQAGLVALDAALALAGRRETADAERERW